MRKVICKIILTIIIISKNEFYQYYTDSVVTGCRPERSELPFSPAYNLLIYSGSFFAFQMDQTETRQLLHMSLAKRCAVTAEALKQTSCQLSQMMPRPWLVVLISVYGRWNCKKEKSWWQTKRKSKMTLCGWVHVTDGPTDRVEQVKSVAFSVYNSCSLLTLKIKNRNTFQNLLLPCLVYFFYSPTRFWWVNKIGSYIVKYFFPSFFYHVCNIFVLILYIKNKQGVPPICAFFFMLRPYLFIFSFFCGLVFLFCF